MFLTHSKSIDAKWTVREKLIEFVMFSKNVGRNMETLQIKFFSKNYITIFEYHGCSSLFQ